MDYTGERGFDPEELLKFELSDYLEKQGKKGLSNELKKSMAAFSSSPVKAEMYITPVMRCLLLTSWA